MKPIAIGIPRKAVSSAMNMVSNYYEVPDFLDSSLQRGLLRLINTPMSVQGGYNTAYYNWLDSTNYIEGLSKEVYRPRPEATRDLLGFTGR